MGLRQSLEDLMEASAQTVLHEGDTVEGNQALLRMTLLMSLLERLQAGDTFWSGSSLLPDTLPLLAAAEADLGPAPLQ